MSLARLINSRNALKNEINKQKYIRLGIEKYWEPVTSQIIEQTGKVSEAVTEVKEELGKIKDTLAIELPNGKQLEINQPKVENELTEEEKELWDKIVNIRNSRKENGTLRLAEIKGNTRIYTIGDRLLALNNNLVLTNVKGAFLKLNNGLAELFFKAEPDYSKFTNDDVKSYRKYLSDIGITVNLKTNKQKYINTKEGDGIVILPSDPRKLQERLQVLIAAKKEGHNNVFNETNEILKLLLDKKIITTLDYKKIVKDFAQ